MSKRFDFPRIQFRQTPAVTGIIICPGIKLPVKYRDHEATWCTSCPCAKPHVHGECRKSKSAFDTLYSGRDTCPGCQPIDEEVYHVVQEEYERWGQNKIKWRTYGIPEEAEVDQSTWDDLVQRQIKIHKEEKAQEEKYQCLMTNQFVSGQLTFS